MLRAVSGQVEPSALRTGVAIGQRRRRPPGRNPKGRGLLRRGFVARLACSAGATGFASLLPTPQNPSGADDST
jgi:hypothetical protein